MPALPLRRYDPGMSALRPTSLYASRPLVYAHRGDRSRAADNTIEAFALAAEAGADGIEFDVRSTVDGVLVISHDPHLLDGTVVGETTFEALRSSHPHVPTLRETVLAIPQHMFLNVEIKSDVPDGVAGGSDQVVTAALAEIEGYDSLERVVLSSFDPGIVAAARAAYPELVCGQLVTSFLPIAEMADLAVGVGANAVNPPMNALEADTQGSIAVLHAAGLAVVVWNANTPEQVAAVTAAGVDVIITDDPGMARRVVDQR